MRFLLIIPMIIFLSGCAIFGAKFDNNEYASLARLESQTRITIKHCGMPNAVSAHLVGMITEVEYLHSYTKHLPRNKETHTIAKIIRANIMEMRNRYKKSKPSATYCRAKLNGLIDNINRTMKAVTSKVH